MNMFKVYAVFVLVISLACVLVGVFTANIEMVITSCTGVLVTAGVLLVNKT